MNKNAKLRFLFFETKPMMQVFITDVQSMKVLIWIHFRLNIYLF